MSETTSIYGLQDPRDRKIYYVGASVDPVQRWKQHVSLSDANGRERDALNAKQGWIAELLDEDLKPLLVILETLDVAARGDYGRQGMVHNAARNAEDRWMLRLHEEGHPITNAKLKLMHKGDENAALLEEAIQRGKELFGT